MKWMITEDKLGQDQREVIEEIGKISNKPIWIKGHAGSGKSVVLLHALSDYLILHPNAKVCIVVFTRALKDLLETGLKQIPRLNGKDIPVLTIYQLKKKIDDNSSNLLFFESIGLSQNLLTPDMLSILGGVSLTKYDAIFCDEVQDIPLDIIKSMKSFCTHLIIAGDEDQSIYNSVPVFGTAPATTKEIQNDIVPLEKKLGVIYRLTESVLKLLKKVFPSMLNDMPNIARVDTEIQLYQFSSLEKEIRYCWKEIKQTNKLRQSEVSAILLPTHDAILAFVKFVLNFEDKEPWQRVNDNYGKPIYTILNNYLQEKDIPIMYIGNSYGSLTEAARENKVVIMTYHSAKGLDFDYVFLPMVNQVMMLHSDVDTNALLLVALSRSKAGLFISNTGDLIPSVKRFLSDIEIKEISENLSEEITL